MADEDKNPTSYDAFETVTISSSSVALTAATYLNQRFALITVETNPVRFRLDGTAPTATVGHILNAGDILELSSREQIVSARFIRKDAADATLSVSYGA